ncbi:MAG TPA: GNAT family N-acetyltransferase [Terriglobia bacterium]|nr:GNAT family N-acetyltransferase [Terriglobia bacterium]
MLTIRPATINDVALLSALIREFAEFEHELEQVVITEQDLMRDGFGADPRFRVLLAEWSGQPAGYALFFDFYSSWVGRPGIFLEDLFVRAAFRGHGVGRALLASVAGIAEHEKRYGLRWEVLDWNEKAIQLYRSLGATFLDQRRAVLLEAPAMRMLAATAPEVVREGQLSLKVD